MGASMPRAKRAMPSKRLSKSDLRQELIRLRREAEAEIERLIDLLDGPRPTIWPRARSARMTNANHRSTMNRRLGVGTVVTLRLTTQTTSPASAGPERMRQGEGGYGSQEDREQCLPLETKVAGARYRNSNRWAPNNDGQHVDAEVVAYRCRRIRNLSDRQREIISPKIDRSEVSI
jgi:hypothetical protein